MWTPLTDALPTNVEDTRTSTALNCLRKLRQDIPDEAKIMYVTNRLGVGLEEALEYLKGYPTEEKGGGERVLDYFQDSHLIHAAFAQAYGLTLSQITQLHWWTFLSLLGGLPSDTRLMEVIRIRTMTIDAKDSAEVKAQKRKAKAAVALRYTKEEKAQSFKDSLNALSL